MKLTGLFILMLSLMLSLFGCGQSQTVVEAESGYATNSSSSETPPSRWPASAFPLQVSIASDFNAEEQTAIAAMTDEWDSQEELLFDINTENTDITYDDLDNFRDSELGIYQLDTWPEALPSSALAVTQIFGRRSGDIIVIDHADILMNYDYFTFASDGSSYDFSTVVLHELGHFLGLYHETDYSIPSIMQPSISRFDQIQTPYDIDHDVMEEKYPELLGSGAEAASSVQRLALTEHTEIPLETEITLRLYLMSDGNCLHEHK